jgi:hypothetical protein
MKRLLIIIAILLYAILLYGQRSHYYAWRLSRLILTEHHTEQEIVDATRGMIHKNTIHLPLGNNDPRTTSDQNVILQGILKTIRGAAPIAATCGPRAEAMKAILEKLDFETRIIHVFSDDYQSVQSHTFLEARINGAWQAQDPDFNAYYLKPDGDRANAKDILDGNAVPSGGWDAYGGNGIPLHSYFEALMYDGRPNTSLMIINQSRFDANKFFPENKKTFLKFSEVYGNLKWQNLANLSRLSPGL